MSQPETVASGALPSYYPCRFRPDLACAWAARCGLGRAFATCCECDDRACPGCGADARLACALGALPCAFGCPAEAWFECGFAA